MKRIIISVIREMRGAFLPKEVRQNELTEDIFDSVSTLVYYGTERDSQNLRNDLLNLGQEMKDSVRASKIKFKIAR